jgi:hypothetical protein
MFDLPDYPSKSQGGFQHTSDVSTRSVGFAWIASMSLHSEDIGHATLPLCLLLCTLWLVACVHGMADETIADLRYIHTYFLIWHTDLAG